MFINLYKTLIRATYPLVLKPCINKRKAAGKEDLNRFNERLGLPGHDRPEGHLIWFHGASIGESVSMLPLINKLLEKIPGCHIMVTTGTVTSAEIMDKRLPDRAFHQYIPLDNPKFTKRFLDFWHPDMVLWFESDFWPAMLSDIKQRNIPLLLVNGRISDRSFKRWQHFKFIIRELLGCFTFCLGQSEEDARRLKILGAPETACLGNLKYAGLPLPVNTAILETLKKQIGNRPLWLLSSTHHDEESQIGRYLKEMEHAVSGLLTLIAPRHPGRGTEIAETLQQYGLKTALRSAGENITPETEVYIADTIGEMGLWYSLSPLTFVGGSLIPHGGQNFMEPSRQHNAVIVGPHMHNFADAMTRARRAGAIIQISDAEELKNTAISLLQNPENLRKHQDKACVWTDKENKVLDGILSKIEGYLA